ncbi:MAG: AI-2E family transporter [Pontibacterium sp.]
MRQIVSKWVDRYFSDEEAMLFFVLLMAALAVILWMGKPLAPVFAGVILAFLMQGGVNALKNRLGFSHIVSVTLVFLLFVGAVLALILIVLPQVWRQTVNLINEMPRIVAEVQQLALLLPEKYPTLVSPEQVTALFNQAASQLTGAGQWILASSFNTIGPLVSLLIYLILVPILVFFFLKDGAVLVNAWTSFLPKKRDMMTRIWHEMDVQIANYIRGKATEIAIVGGVTYLVFAILGVNYAALLAIVVGLSVLIPYIGATLATLPVAVIGFIQWGVSSEFMYLLVAYAIIQALDGNVLVPLLFSEAVNLHPVSIIISVLVFGSLWGFWGLFFAIPLATLVKSVANAWPRAKEIEE